MVHYGDIKKINGADVPIVDVICGGSPCQDLSVAGKRAGLAGERSGLFMDQIRIIKEMREHDRAIKGADVDRRSIRPRYMVWENVPGAFSSNKGEDFRAVLEETAKVICENAVIPRPSGGGKWSPSGCIMGDGWSIAWRVHDAQFWGVPQRRKRISLVADFGGETAPEILFERKGVFGDIEESGEEREGAATNVRSGIEETGGGNVPMVMESKASGFNGWQSTTSSMPIIDNGTPPIEATMPPYVCESSDGDIAGTLDANYYKGCGERQGVERTVVAMTTEMTPKIDEKDKGFSLRSRDYKDPQCVAYANEAYDKWSESEKGASLRASGGVYGGGSETLSASNSVVRRLTPLECERLQGYPDGWTDIGEWIDSKGKKHKDADSPRYKALGNSIALPFWQWMAKRMRTYLGDNPTMASLFDGISGFCLVFARAGVKPVFSSEIEEFPIAVAKKHFGDDEKGVKGDYEKYL